MSITKSLRRLASAEAAAGTRPTRATTPRGLARWLLRHRARHARHMHQQNTPVSDRDRRWWIWWAGGCVGSPPADLPRRLPRGWAAVPVLDFAAESSAAEDIAPTTRRWWGGKRPTTEASGCQLRPGYAGQRTRHELRYRSYVLVGASGRAAWLVRHGHPTVRVSRGKYVVVADSLYALHPDGSRTQIRGAWDLLDQRDACSAGVAV